MIAPARDIQSGGDGAVERRPGKLWSLWEMLVLDGKRFAEIFRVLGDVREHSIQNTGALSDDIIANKAQGVQETLKRLSELDLPVSLSAVHELLSCNTHQEVHEAIKLAMKVVAWELKGRKFYGPLRHFEKYYENGKLFGDEVFDSFPSANEDIQEAGTCLALERGTACVMHLMHVVEIGLKALAGAVGVPPQNDWGSYLREIDKELALRIKTSGARSADEQFYAEVAITIDHMRRSWRNPTLHPEKTYSPERAEEILIAVSSFMKHLATRLSEPLLAKKA
jgi:hypothetical protein